MALLRRKNANPEGRMSLADHFREFRNRVVISAIAIVIGAVVGWIYFDVIWNHLTAPLMDFAKGRHLEDKVSVNFNQATQAFSVRLKISMWCGLILASPVWLWQIWAFLVPGLTKKEKARARWFIFSAVPLFVGGCVLGSYTINGVLDVLYGFTPKNASNIIDASNYLGFVMKFILLFGLAFLLPVFLVGLNAAHILPGRVMLKGWRIAVFGIAVFSAMMSPTPDAWTMLVLMVPMILLYYIACGISIWQDKRRAKRADDSRPDWMDTADDEASPL